MSDESERLARWVAHGATLIAALPPVDEAADREANAALARYHASRPPGRKLTRAK